MFTTLRIRKLGGLLTLLALVVPILAGCGVPTTGTTTSASSPAASSAASGSSAATTTGRLAEPVTIEIMSGVQSSELPAPGPDWIVAQAVKEQLNIDLKMTWVTQNSEYDRLVLTRGAANDLPDLFRSSTAMARDLGGQGLLADWTPFLQYMPTFVAEREVEQLAATGTFDGQLLALTTKNPTPFKQAVSIRQDWLDKLGLQTPKTLDEYLAVMKAFTEQDPDGNGANDTYGWSGSVNTLGQISKFDPIFGAFGALPEWTIDGSQLVYGPTTPERLAALQFINRMYQEGVIDPDWTTQKDPDFRNKWKAGKIGMFQDDWCATYCAGHYDPFAQANPTGRLVDIAPPVGPNDTSAVSTYSRVGHQYSMSQRAVEAGKGEAIARLMEWFNTDGHFLVLYGEEGTMWQRDGEKIVLDQNNDYRIVRALAPYGYKGAPEENPTIFDQTATYPNGETVAVWPIVQRAEQNPKVDITDLTVLPPAPPDRAADLTRIRAEAELQFMTGQRSFDEWDAYVASMQAAGLDDWKAQAEARAKEIGLLK